MKKVLAWVLLVVMLLGMLAGCKKPVEEPTNPVAPTEPSVDAPTDYVPEGATAEEALKYLRAIYKDTEEPTPTPVDYERYGVVRIAGIPFTIVWTVDVSEDLIKIVVNEDGTVTIDVNESCEVATPYTLTATITDAAGNSASHSWDMLLPAAVDMTEIVKAAYALGVGESLPYAATLRGKIVGVNTVYSAEYKNISVTIAVEGAEDMPILCYRLKGDGIDKLLVGNIITVTGTLKNYNGTIEFDAGCTLDAVEEGDAVEAPTDPGEILKAAYALKNGEQLPNPATLTGTVTVIDSPYDPGYGNISVIIQVEGYPQYPIICFRMKGVDVSKVAVKDLITVSGIIKNYNGKIEFDAGCQMIDRVSGGGVAEGPSSDQNKILTDANKLGVGEKLPYVATLTGEVYSIDSPFSSQYNNVTVTMLVGGQKIQCYRLKGDGADQIRETDTITVSGVIENYNGKLEFGTGCTLVSWVKGPRNVSYGPLKEGVAYRLYVDQKTVGKTLYFNGQYSSNRLNTTDKGSEGVDIYVERVAGKGVRFYFMSGETKTYIGAEDYTNDKGQNRGRAAIGADVTTCWTYDSSLGVYLATVTAGKHFLGAYGTYETITASWVGYIDGTNSGSGDQFVAKFMEASKVPADPGSGEGGEGTGSGTVVDAPVAGTAYKFGMVQKNVSETDVYYLIGGMASYYMATGADVNAAIDVYLEETTGGYYMYTLVDGVKTYINMVVSGTHVNGAYEATASTVYTYDAEAKTVIADVNGEPYWFGTRNDNTYTTVGPCKTSFNGFYCQFYTATEGGETPEDPDTPVVPDVPVTGTTATQITELPKDGDVIVIVNGENAMTGTASGKKLAAEAATITDGVLTLTDAMAKLVVSIDANGYYTFTVDGKYLTSGATGNELKLADAASDYSLWTVEAAVDGTFYIKNVNAKFGSNVQSLEYYSGFTTYGHKDTEIYQMKLFAVSAEPEAPTGGQLMTTAPVTGDVVVIVNGENAMTGTASGKKLAAEAITVTDGILTLTDTMAKLTVSVDANGYYTFTMDGKYLTSGATGNELKLADEASDYSLWTVEAATEDTWYIKNVNAKFGSNVQSMEYYSGFTTYGHKDTNIYQMKLYKVGAGSVTPPETPDEPDTPVVPDEPTEGGVVETPVAGTAYKFGMVQKNVSETDVYYLIGGMASYYMATGTDVTAAIDVYLEETTGGYYMYTLVDGVKTYINMVVSGTHVNGAYEAAASTVYTYDADAKTVIADVNGEPYWFGTRNDNTYTTVGPCKTSFNGFYCQFYTVGSSETPDEPDTPVVPDEPETPETPAENRVDFETIVGKTNGGDSSYSNSYTTTNGWVTTNSAIQMGGPNAANPAFPVIGPDNTYKAACLNGKTSAPGKLTSPTLSGGITKLTLSYTKMFTDTQLAVTITVTDLANNTTYTHTVSKEAAKDDKYTVWTDEWTLDTPITGEFTIVVENACPSAQNKNCDRMTILDLTWESAASEPETEGGQLLTTAPVTGDVIAIVNGENAMSATANGKKLAGETATITDGVLAVTETLAQLITVVDENGYYTFVTADGKYLTSGGTGNELKLADAPSAFSLWNVEAATEGTFYIKSVNAKYNNTVQSMEYYSGFTTYGHKDTAIYQMQLYKLGTGTAPEAPEEDLDSYTEMTIAEARAAETGAKVQVTGVVARITYATGFKPSGVVLVDNTSSIYVYDADLAAQCVIGYTVTVAASKTYWVLETEQANADKFGYKGCNQLESAKVIEIKATEAEFDKTWIEETTVQDMMNTPYTEDVTSKIFKVTALVKEVPGNGFTNFYINDLDGYTGTYSYSQCSGEDFAWLREFDGKICTVYVMALNAKATASGCNWRFLPVLVEDNGFDPSTVNFAENAVKFYGVPQFLANYSGDPAAELKATVDNELLGYTGAKLTYVSSDPSVVSIDENVLHCHKTGTAKVTVTGEHNGVTYSEDVTIEVKIVDVNAEYPTVADAIAAAVDTTVTVKGIVGPSLVNQDGFYLIDDTGVIAVLTTKDTLATLEVGYEVVLEGTRYYKAKNGVLGNTCISNAEVLLNNYGSHNYSTASFDGELTLAEFVALDVNTDYTTSVFTVTATVELVETAFYTSIKLVDGDSFITLYCSSANQYSWLKQYAGQSITMELAPCNWSSKNVYPACVLAVVHGDGTKTVNTLNFN